MTTPFSPLLLAGLLLGTAAAAGAQGTPRVPGPGSSARQAADMAAANAARARLANGAAPAPRPVAGPGTRPAIPARSYAYVPTEALRQATVRRAVANAQPGNPAGARVIQDFFGTQQRPYQPYYDTARRNTSLPDNDAAAAMAIYLLAGYLIINNYRTDPTTPAQAQGVRSQLLPLLATNPRFGTPAAIAQTGEDMKLQTVLLTAGWQQSIKAGTSEAFRRNTAAYFTSHFNRDFARTRLTSQGFLPK